MLVLYRELKLVALNGGFCVLGIVARLDHLALVGLKDVAFFLKIVDVALVHSFAIHKEELDKHKRRQSQNNNGGYPKNEFLFHIGCWFLVPTE